MDRRQSAYDGVVFHHHVTSQRAAIAEDHVIADEAIVRHV